MSLPRVPRSRPRPKLRAIPRQKTESSLYAEMQQLTVEKQRLQQELEYLQERASQIDQRLGEIDHSMQELKAEAEAYDPQSPSPPTPPSAQRSAPPNTPYPPMTFEY